MQSSSNPRVTHFKYSELYGRTDPLRVELEKRIQTGIAQRANTEKEKVS